MTARTVGEQRVSKNNSRERSRGYKKQKDKLLKREGHRARQKMECNAL
jgi:hypothetical protein